ncbi:hypothetical protein UFOVP270_21 [uncultured Caudovirales phage]|uniref:Uncharacterized protein n=1 Tax=uncultured Caudovirales phage TaxID=2100421 RepID=A0A6J5L9F1_9CAUD|nr:hypothetical protein UFOVP101_35 [uncultured Caudovirales phage]CAB4134138.1 hypothetical protein UFOVP270_21 [uncultured Caudovirales phage]
MRKDILKWITISIFSPMVLVVTGALFLIWIFIIGYSKISGKDETKIEKKIEHIVEKNLESSLSLPEGTLEDKLNFMVVPSRKEGHGKQGD